MACHFIVYVNSKFRTSGTSSNFTYAIDFPQSVGYGHFNSVCMLQASIPKSYYLIDTGRNTFVLNEGAVAVTVTIPRGNYNRRSFARTVRDLLLIVSPNHFNYDIGIPNIISGPETGKYLFSVTNNPTLIPISFTFGSASSPSAQLGFGRNTINNFNANSLESTYVANLQVSQALIVVCDNVVNGKTQVLQELFTSSPDFSMLSFNVGLNGGIKPNIKLLKTTLTNSFQFKFMTPEYELVDFNGLDVVFSIVIWQTHSSQLTLEEPKFNLNPLDQLNQSNQTNQDNQDVQE